MTGRSFDLIVVGGGVFGLSTALEAGFQWHLLDKGIQHAYMSCPRASRRASGLPDVSTDGGNLPLIRR